MKILYTRTFKKDLEKLTDKKVVLQLQKEIEHINTIKNISEISDLIKMEGYKNYFRKRIGNYRLGCKIENNEITFVRFKHRKDIYKVFP